MDIDVCVKQCRACRFKIGWFTDWSKSLLRRYRKDFKKIKLYDTIDMIDHNGQYICTCAFNEKLSLPKILTIDCIGAIEHKSKNGFHFLVKEFDSLSKEKLHGVLIDYVYHSSSLTKCPFEKEHKRYDEENMKNPLELELD